MPLKSLIGKQRSGRLLLQCFRKRWLILIYSFQLGGRYHLMCSQKDGTNHSVFSILKKSMMKYISMEINVTRGGTIMKFMQMIELLDMWLHIQETLYKV